MLLFGDADAGIRHRDNQLLVVTADLDRNGALLGELHRIVEQIGNHLAHSDRIDIGQVGELILPLERDLQPLAVGQCGMAADHIAHHRLQTAGLAIEVQLTRLDFGKVEDIVDQIEQVVGRALHIAQQIALVIIELAHAQQLQHAVHARDGGSQLMAHGGQKKAASLHRLLGRGARLTQLMLLLLDGGDVLHHAVEQAIMALLRHKVAADLDIALPLNRGHQHLHIERLKGLRMFGHLIDKGCHSLIVQAEDHAARLGCHQLLVGHPENVAGALGQIEEFPLAGPLPEILIDQTRHAVGDVPQPALHFPHLVFGGLEGTDIGQYRQHPLNRAVCCAIGQLDVDHVQGNIPLALGITRSLEDLAGFPDRTLLAQHLLPLVLGHIAPAITFFPITDKQLAVCPVAEGQAMIAIPQRHHIG